ncbi:MULTISPECIES: hypothetical protein [Francisella]|uniref:Uncharacterized protein n=1 Tax=Francisella opportunistica TaxID=2016517 RepID=A0A345JR82_9GAMM|nr:MULTISPECIES: hypothetical protein [Francisella]APC91548.1 hypothetical protein BBG19_0812 [Francisella sp. MA067296]AXH29828.1 hypothetical protein CGC43_04135 [Francisella opportunistica]AXH31477.1 hypothetical protein CGC44_04095 [Francisella opportunistica]AXH33123.1 hypothetical protein CGC45_04115 [Francisella opportunistica]
MSTTGFTEQLTASLNEAIQTTSNKNAVFDRLIYSNVFDGQVKVDQSVRDKTIPLQVLKGWLA